MEAIRDSRRKRHVLASVFLIAALVLLMACMVPGSAHADWQKKGGTLVNGKQTIAKEKVGKRNGTPVYAIYYKRSPKAKKKVLCTRTCGRIVLLGYSKGKLYFGDSTYKDEGNCPIYCCNTKSKSTKRLVWGNNPIVRGRYIITQKANSSASSCPLYILDMKTARTKKIKDMHAFTVAGSRIYYASSRDAGGFNVARCNLDGSGKKILASCGEPGFAYQVGVHSTSWYAYDGSGDGILEY